MGRKWRQSHKEPNASIEWGTWARSERDVLRLGARALGAAVELHYLTAPVEVLFERIRRRGREVPPLDRAALARWSALFPAPTAEEMALFDEPVLLSPIVDPLPNADSTDTPPSRSLSPTT